MTLHRLLIIALSLVAVALHGCQKKNGAARRAAAGGSPSVKPVAVDSKTVDLLTRIDPARDQLRGEFSLVSGALNTPSIPAAQLALPVLPPAEYRLEVEAEKVSGNGSMNVGLIVGGRPVALVLEGWGTHLSGLNMVDGQTAQNNATTYRLPVFKPGQPLRLICTVLPRSVIVQCDGKRIIEWEGDPQRLSLDDRFALPEARDRLTIGSWDAALRITRLNITALSGEVLPAASSVASTPSQSAPGNSWTEFAPAEYGFTVLFPSAAERQAIDSGVQFTSATDEGAYIVAVTQAELDNQSPNDYLSHVQSQMFTSGERTVRERMVNAPGVLSAKEIAVIDSENDVYVVRFFLQRERLYQAMYVGPQARIDAAETVRFLDSFRLSAN